MAKLVKNPLGFIGRIINKPLPLNDLKAKSLSIYNSMIRDHRVNLKQGGQAKFELAYEIVQYQITTRKNNHCEKVYVGQRDGIELPYEKYATRGLIIACIAQLLIILIMSFKNFEKKVNIIPELVNTLQAIAQLKLKVNWVFFSLQGLSIVLFSIYISMTLVESAQKEGQSEGEHKLRSILYSFRSFIIVCLTAYLMGKRWKLLKENNCVCCEKKNSQQAQNCRV